MNRWIWLLLLAFGSGCVEDAEAFSRRPGDRRYPMAAAYDGGIEADGGDASVPDTGVPPDAGYTNTHAIDFGGTDERITTADIATDSATRVVWSTWLKNANCGGTEYAISKLVTSGTLREWTIGLQAGSTTCRPVVALYTDGTGGANIATWTAADNTFAEGVWDHLCVSYDGSQTGDANRLRTFVNGVEITGAGAFTGLAVPATLWTGTAPVLLGAQHTASGFMTGSQDETAIWIAGTPPSCATIYNANVLVNPVSYSPAPAHCWNINGDVANSITDRCGSAAGTMVNMEAGDIQGTDLPP